MAAGKVPFVAAVETSDDGRPLKMQLRRVSGFRQAAIQRYAHQTITPASQIVSGGGRSSVEDPAFNWVNTALGNVKMPLPELMPWATIGQTLYR